MSELTLPVLATSKADVLETFKRFGFVPTTDKERAERQTGHVEQCLCRFCQARKAA